MSWPRMTAAKGAGDAEGGSQVQLAARARAEAFLGEVVEQLGRLVDSELCSILLVEGDRLLPRRGHRSAARVPDRGRRLRDRSRRPAAAATAAYSGETMRQRGHRDRPALGGLPPRSPATPGCARAWSVPLKLPDGAGPRHLRHLSRSSRSRPEPEQVEMVEALRLDRRPRARQRPPQGRARGQLRGRGPRPDLGPRRPRRLHRLALDRDLAPGARGLRAARPATTREIEVIARVAALHDVGKLGVPTEILSSSPDR